MKKENSLELPFFSVIITTYNRKKLLERALSSLLNQTEKDWEVVLIDDGSEDGTSEMIPAYQKKIPRFSYVYQENKGFIQAKNEGIRRSKGEYLTFLDSDDEWLPEKTEKQICYLENYKFEVDFIASLWNYEKVNFPYSIGENNLVEITLKKLLLKIKIKVNVIASRGIFLIITSLRSTSSLFPPAKSNNCTICRYW